MGVEEGEWCVERMIEFEKGRKGGKVSDKKGEK